MQGFGDTDLDLSYSVFRGGDVWHVTHLNGVKDVTNVKYPMRSI